MAAEPTTATSAKLPGGRNWLTLSASQGSSTTRMIRNPMKNLLEIELGGLHRRDSAARRRRAANSGTPRSRARPAHHRIRTMRSHVPPAGCPRSRADIRNIAALPLSIASSPRRATMLARTPDSSSTSRRAACSAVSPASIMAFGKNPCGAARRGRAPADIRDPCRRPKHDAAGMRQGIRHRTHPLAAKGSPVSQTRRRGQCPHAAAVPPRFHPRPPSPKISKPPSVTTTVSSSLMKPRRGCAKVVSTDTTMPDSSGRLAS